MKYEYLDDAFESFVKMQTQDSYLEFLMTMFLLAKEDKEILVPTRMIGGQLEYKLVRTNAGYFYAACTNKDELLKIDAPSFIVMKLDQLIVRAANDKQVGGICFNPENDTPCFIPKEYMRKILDDLEGEDS